jgi:hypothetical protein
MAITWTTPQGLLTTASVNVFTSITVSASNANSYKVISGQLPVGLSFSSTGTISGIPNVVEETTHNKFVIRASNTSTIADRTFFIDVGAVNTNFWTSQGGYLPVGYHGDDYILNHKYVDYSIALLTTSTSALKFYMNDLNLLPPGLTLTEEGRLYGVVKDKFVATTSTMLGYPHLYQFDVVATDGIVKSTSGIFKILVVSPDMLRADSGLFGFTTSSFINLNSNTSVIQDIASLGYVEAPQFVNSSDLGIVRANNNEFIPVTAYDASPFQGPITYSIQEGRPEIATTTTYYTKYINNFPVNFYTSTTYTNYIPDPAWSLPTGLQIDSTTGYIYGHIPYQPEYSKQYNLNVFATKTDIYSGNKSTGTNIFNLIVEGNVSSYIEWVSDSDLGSINFGVTSDLAVVAKQVNSAYTIKYKLIDGSLPVGLTLQRDGTITGYAYYWAPNTYSFTVEASDVYGLSAVSRTFTLSTVKTDNIQYTKIWLRPFLKPEKRTTYQSFTADTFIFDPTLIYRYYDPNFGVQHDIKVVLEFGIEKMNIDDYVPALRQSFYRKRLYFGDVKTAIAQDIDGNILYEVVYVDVVDDMAGASSVVYSGNNILYPGSIDNMKTQLRSLEFQDGSIIGVNDYLEPKFMRTLGSTGNQIPMYMKVIPLCYALPGQGQRIVNRIKLSGFDFKLLDFEIDRLVVQDTLDGTTAKYLIFERQSVGDTIPSDDILYEENITWEFNDGVILTRT